MNSKNNGNSASYCQSNEVNIEKQMNSKNNGYSASCCRSNGVNDIEKRLFHELNYSRPVYTIAKKGKQKFEIYEQKRSMNRRIYWLLITVMVIYFGYRAFLFIIDGDTGVGTMEIVLLICGLGVVYALHVLSALFPESWLDLLTEAEKAKLNDFLDYSGSSIRICQTDILIRDTWAKKTYQTVITDCLLKKEPILVSEDNKEDRADDEEKSEKTVDLNKFQWYFNDEKRKK